MIYKKKHIVIFGSFKIVLIDEINYTYMFVFDLSLASHSSHIQLDNKKIFETRSVNIKYKEN